MPQSYKCRSLPREDPQSQSAVFRALRIQPHHSREHWLPVPTSIYSLAPAWQSPRLHLHAEMGSENVSLAAKRGLVTREIKRKCSVEFRKGCLSGRPALQLTCGMRHDHKGWGFRSHFGARGTVHGSQGFGRCSGGTAQLRTMWHCFLSPSLLLSVRSSHERETKAPILSAVVWGFSIAYSCMQFLTDMPVNNNVFVENGDVCYSSTPKPFLAE